MLQSEWFLNINSDVIVVDLHALNTILATMVHVMLELSCMVVSRLSFHGRNPTSQINSCSPTGNMIWFALMSVPALDDPICVILDLEFTIDITTSLFSISVLI